MHLRAPGWSTGSVCHLLFLDVVVYVPHWAVRPVRSLSVISGALQFYGLIPLSRCRVSFLGGDQETKVVDSECLA